MAKVLGIGGVFVKTADKAALGAWYRRVLGIELNDLGGADFPHAPTGDAFGDNARTVWGLFAEESDYFSPSPHDVMINFIVDDLNAMLERARVEGAQIVGEPEHYDYGAFGWILDPDGRKIELWRPADKTADGFQNSDD